MTSLRALIPVTEDNLDPEAYLLANADVAAAGIDPRVHFRLHGRHEGRRQVNRNYLSESSAYRREKFERFKSVLNVELPQEVASFPITTGGQHFDLSQYQAESANGDYGPFVKEIASHPDRIYLDLGCGLRQTVFSNCLYLEVYPSLTADLVVEPDCTYPINDAAFDGIGSFAVLEHTRKPWLVVEEMFRMLKPGGMVWIVWPFLQPVHGYPSHYFNATREGLRTLFEDTGFVTDRIGTESFQGFDHTFTWTLMELMRQLPEKTRKRIGGMSVNAFLMHQPGSPFWQELLSQVDERTRETLACGNTLVATKPL